MQGPGAGVFAQGAEEAKAKAAAVGLPLLLHQQHEGSPLRTSKEWAHARPMRLLQSRVGTVGVLTLLAEEEAEAVALPFMRGDRERPRCSPEAGRMRLIVEA